MHSPDQQESYMQLAAIKPSILLEGDKPRIIEKWPMAPQLWDAIGHREARIINSDSWLKYFA